MKKIILGIIVISTMSGCSAMKVREYDKGYKQAIYDSIQEPELWREIQNKIISESYI